MEQYLHSCVPFSESMEARRQSMYGLECVINIVVLNKSHIPRLDEQDTCTQNDTTHRRISIRRSSNESVLPGR